MIPTAEVLLVGAALLGIGLAGVLIRRNMLVVLMSVELMLNGVNVTLVAFSRVWGDSGGQSFAFFIIALAAAEAAVGLGILVAVFRSYRTVAVDRINLMKR